ALDRHVALAVAVETAEEQVDVVAKAPIGGGDRLCLGGEARPVGWEYEEKVIPPAEAVPVALPVAVHVESARALRPRPFARGVTKDAEREAVCAAPAGQPDEHSVRAVELAAHIRAAVAVEVPNVRLGARTQARRAGRCRTPGLEGAEARPSRESDRKGASGGGEPGHIGPAVAVEVAD